MSGAKKPKELKGQRMTAQRALLLNLIRRSEGHLDADELHRKAREYEPRISLSTVYRNLRLFKELGLVDEYHFDEDHHHYEVKPSTEHYHLVCLICEQIVEIESPLTQQMKDEVGREYGFEISGGEIHLTGYCRRCAPLRQENVPSS
jgi:Fe2+ or Zn2+ uptake regulation protein